MADSGTPRLSNAVLWGYGVGSLGTSLYATITNLLLLFFLTNVAGIPAGWAAVVFFIPKLWDVVTDPLMGGISDRTNSRWGRRRPYLLAGSLVLGVSFPLLFSLPPFDSALIRALYVGFWFVVAATGYTLFMVPYLAMPAEMTSSYHELTRIMSYRLMFLLVGILAAGGLAPMIVDLAQVRWGTQIAYSLMSVVMGLLGMFSMLASFWGTRSAPVDGPSFSSVPWRRQLQVALANRPFFVLLLPYFIQIVAISCIVSTLPFFVRFVLGGSDATVTAVFLCLTGPAVLAMPLWVRISARRGKLWAFALSVAGMGILVAGIWFSRGDAMPWFYAQVFVIGIMYAGTQLFPFAMLPDTIAADTLTSGERREGIFTGVWTAGEKTGVAVGAALAGLILEQSGFVTGTGELQRQPESALLGIKVAFCGLPAILLLSSLVLLRRYDLSEDKLDQMRQAQ